MYKIDSMKNSIDHLGIHEEIGLMTTGIMFPRDYKSFDENIEIKISPVGSYGSSDDCSLDDFFKLLVDGEIYGTIKSSCRQGDFIGASIWSERAIELRNNIKGTGVMSVEDFQNSLPYYDKDRFSQWFHNASFLKSYLGTLPISLTEPDFECMCHEYLRLDALKDEVGVIFANTPLQIALNSNIADLLLKEGLRHLLFKYDVNKFAVVRTTRVAGSERVVTLYEFNSKLLLEVL